MTSLADRRFTGQSPHIAMELPVSLEFARWWHSNRFKAAAQILIAFSIKVRALASENSAAHVALRASVAMPSSAGQSVWSPPSVMVGATEAQALLAPSHFLRA